MLIDAVNQFEQLRSYEDEDGKFYWSIPFQKLHTRAWQNGFSVDELDFKQSQRGLTKSIRID